MRRRFIFILSFLLTLFSVSQANDQDFVERAYYGALFEPKATVHNGAGQDTGVALRKGRKNLPDGFLEFAEALGEDRYPILWMTYTSLSQPRKTIINWGEHVRSKLEETGRKDIMPQIGLNLTGGHDTGEGLDELIAKGKYDDRIDAFCQALEIIDRPMFVRIGYEFEGSWNGYKPDSFIKTWIRITKAIREREIKAATVWCSAGGSAGPLPLSAVLAYYPGDEWVDWWGVDVFSPEEIPTDKLKEFCIEAGKRNFPVMLGEVTPRYVGVLDGKESWDKWFGPFFQFVRSRPEVKSICYINWDWDFWAETLGFQWIDWKDSRIQNNQYVLDAYRKEMDSPLYQHSQKN